MNAPFQHTIDEGGNYVTICKAMMLMITSKFGCSHRNLSLKLVGFNYNWAGLQLADMVYIIYIYIDVYLYIHSIYVKLCNLETLPNSWLLAKEQVLIRERIESWKLFGSLNFSPSKRWVAKRREETLMKTISEFLKSFGWISIKGCSNEAMDLRHSELV